MPDDDKQLTVSETPDAAPADAPAEERPGALDADKNREARQAGRQRRAEAAAAIQAARAGTLRLNDLPAPPRKSRKRVGRGIGSGTGKTAGRGHKGARSRSGARRGRVTFEGGQTPLQRRLPKRGFVSRKALFTAQIRLSDIAKLAAKLADKGEKAEKAEVQVDLDILKKNGLVPKNTKRARVYLRGDISRQVILTGIPATAGARAAIEKAGGKLAPPTPPAPAPATEAKSKEAAAK